MKSTKPQPIIDYKISREITVVTDFIGLHKWEDCPYEEVSFLRSPHRHRFYVRATLPVNHNERDREFFMVQKDLIRYTALLANPLSIPEGTGMSCESMASTLCKWFMREYELPWVKVSVSEDDENSATIKYEI